MGKAVAILGLLLMIAGFIPLILPMVGLPQYAAYFYLGIFEYTLLGYTFSEVMIALIGLGLILLIIGAVK